MNAEQMSLFEMIGEPVTPVIPPEKQKKDGKGWIIEISGILLKKNGWKENAICVCTRPIRFLEDTRKDKHGRLWQNAETTHGPYGGWVGTPKKVYSRRPTWSECVEYAKKRYSIPETIKYMEEDANFNKIWNYEDGYKKGG